MLSEMMKATIEDLKKEGKMSFVEGTSEEKIAEYEEEKGIKFPKQYKEWLEFSDGGELYLPAGIQLYGIEHKPLINVDDDCRPSEEYIVIGALASGDPILFQKGKEKISIYNQEVNRIEDDEVYDDFISFIKDLHNILGVVGNSMARRTSEASRAIESLENEVFKNDVKDDAIETECNKKYSKSNEVYEPLNNFITKGMKCINDCFLKHPKITHAFKIFTPIVVFAGVVGTVAYKVKSSATKRVSDCESESENIDDNDDIFLEEFVDKNQSNDFVNDENANLEDEDSVQYESRNSPQEHTVKEHKQSYHTKNGIIERNVASYRRGVRKEDDLDE